jgi:hypothetical protein
LRVFKLEKAHAKKMAKRNEGQPIENKRFCEIVDSAPSMISMACDPRCETIRFVWRNESFVLAVLGLVSATNEMAKAGWARAPSSVAERACRVRIKGSADALAIGFTRARRSPKSEFLRSFEQ